MKTEYPMLFSPIKINQMMLKNRIIATPVGDSYEPAKGGAAVVITHSIGVDLPNSFWGKFNYGFSKYELENTKAEIMRAHSAGAKASIEVFHAGAQAKVGPGEYCVGPCDMVNDDGCQVKAMTEEDMDQVVEAYAKEARDAKKLGFDMLFLHFAHGWLPAEFLSPLYNHRTDQYGGSLENRARFPLRILKAVREAVGPGFPIDMRISAVEYVPGSISFEDTLEFVKMAEPYIDMVNVSSGLDKGFGYAANVQMATTIFEPHEINVKYAAEIKKNVSIPVAVVGGIETPEEAEEILESGKADLVSLGRAWVADPNWANKAMCGKADEIVPCIRCLQCYHIATDHWNKGCSVNPVYANEGFVIPEAEIRKNEVSKKVVVIGAGPAGIMAALAADDKGNQVILLDKANEIGGLLRYIQQEHFKEDTKAYFEYLQRRIDRSNVDVRLNTTATREYVAELEPDYLIVAVGSRAVKLNLPGTDNPHVHDLLDVIGNYQTLGDRVVIIGGGVNGAETALGLAMEEQKQVTVLEMTDTIAAQSNNLFKISFWQKANECDNLNFLTETKCLEIKDKTVLIEQGGKREEIPYDDIIISVGMRSNPVDEFYGITPNTVSVGDCNQVRKIQEAAFEGYTAGCNTN